MYHAGVDTDPHRQLRPAALREFTGYSSSVIACDAETGLERGLDPADTPDGRPGASVLAFGFSSDALSKAIATRTGQCLMTCPTTSVFDGYCDAEQFVPLGKNLRFFFTLPRWPEGTLIPCS